jgi:hypothetical protein
MDAKIDALLKTAGIHFDRLQDVPAGVREALQRGETILAVKRYRQATGVGLKEAKEFVDEIRRRQIVCNLRVRPRARQRQASRLQKFLNLRDFSFDSRITISPGRSPSRQSKNLENYGNPLGIGIAEVMRR